MAEVLGRYSNLGPQGAQVAKAHETALRDRRTVPWVSPRVTVTTVRRMTVDEIEAMVADYRSGIGSWRLARKYGVTEATVLTRLKVAGVSIAEVQAQRSAASAGITEEMRHLREAGWPMTATVQSGRRGRFTTRTNSVDWLPNLSTKSW